MKKMLIGFLLLVLSVSSVFAYQENYRKSSEEVQTFYTLRTISGTATVEPVFPISGTQLLNLVKQLDSSKFTGKTAEMYSNLVEKLEKPSVLLKYKDSGSNLRVPVLLAESNYAKDTFFYKVVDYPSMLSINCSVYFSKYFSGEFDYGFDVRLIDTDRRNKLFTSVKDVILKQFAAAPNRAYGSVGYDKFNFTVGRDRVSEGMGITGNLTLAENFYSEDYSKISYLGEKIAYDFTWIDYDDNITHSSEYPALEKDSKQVVQHRISATFFDRVSVSVAEGALIYTSDIFNNPEFLNPFMFIHNTGTFYDGKTNNWFEVAVSGQLPYGFEINTEAFIDQLVIGDENPESTGRTSFAALANVKKAWSLDDSIVKAYAEFVYTNEDCYLKGTNVGYGDYKSYADVDLYVQLSDFEETFNLAPIGYIYGTDVMTIAAGVSLEKWNQTFTFDAMYRTSGPNGGYTNEIRDLAEIYKGATGLLTQQTIGLTLGAKGVIYRGITYSAKAGLAWHKNLNHEASDSFVFDPQYAVSISIEPLKMFKKLGTNL